MKRSLISVGVDVGTATTKIILSRLQFADQSAGLGVPRVRLVGREILYRSRLAETPVAGRRLDEERLLASLELVYAEAGIAPALVESGGVIITGEAARAENARQLVERLAHRAGAFVVATAGPHLEAALAGRGSGAAARSEVTGGVVAAVDIGGGTTNIALFRHGRLLDTACLNLGGRAIRLDPQTGRVTRISPAARSILQLAGLPVMEESLPHAADAVWLVAAVADQIAGALAGEAADFPGLYDGASLGPVHAVGEVWLSGGVGAFAGESASPAEVLHYGDIGPALGWALPAALTARGFTVRRPVETTFATVIGVGVHHLSLSGATVRISHPALLPLTNLPVVRIDQAEADSIQRRAALQPADTPVALALPRIADPSFAGLERLAAAIQAGMAERLGRGQPLVVVTEQDLAAALGLILQSTGSPHVIILDEVQVAAESYIDIGRPLGGGLAVPVVVKTLVFAAGGEESL